MKIRYIAIVGKAGQGKTLLSELLKIFFGRIADVTSYAIGETHFTNGIESYARLIDDPKNIGKYGLKITDPANAITAKGQHAHNPKYGKQDTSLRIQGFLIGIANPACQSRILPDGDDDALFR